MALIGSPITLAELKSLAEFVRWQDIGARVADLIAAKRLSNGYPLVSSRLPGSVIDLCVGRHWQKVEFVRIEGTPLQGNQRIVYLDKGTEKSVPYDWFGVAPAGHYTEWTGPRPNTLASAKLLQEFEVPQHEHRIYSQKVVKEDWPYLTFEAKSAPRMGGDTWIGSYTIHAADPRVKIEGISPRQPWFNTTIAVSHRWLCPDHPDPDRKQYNELMNLCESFGLHENQAFLIDYCSLPQQPRSSDEASWFRENLPGFQTQFKYVTMVLNTGSADYAKRAWCMLELMLAAMNRAKRPTLINHDRLDGPLRDARQLARTYVEHDNLNSKILKQSLAGKPMTHKTFLKWAQPVNIGLYNATYDGRRSMRKMFEDPDQLSVKDENDRPIILDLLKRLVEISS